MTRLRKECDDLKAAEIRALKAKKEMEAREAEEGATASRTAELMDIKKEEDIKKEGDDVCTGLEDSKVGVLAAGATGDADGGSPDSGGTAEAAAAAAARMLELKGKSDTAKIEQLQKQLTKDQETIKDLKSQLKKSNNEMKERSLLLEMYKTCTKEIRDKAQLMAAEKRVRSVTESCAKWCIIFGFI
jgi:E3 ubiquitin-protein ligase BRE1